MSFWAGIGIFVGVIFLLTWVGALLVRKNPGTQWEEREDKPIIGHDL